MKKIPECSWGAWGSDDQWLICLCKEITSGRETFTEQLLETFCCLKCWCIFIFTGFCFGLGFFSPREHSLPFKWAQVLFEVSSGRLLFLHLGAFIWSWCFSLSFHSAEISSVASAGMKDAQTLCESKASTFSCSLKFCLRMAPLFYPTWLCSPEDKDVYLMWTPGSPLTYRHLLNMILFLSPGEAVTETDL